MQTVKHNHDYVALLHGESALLSNRLVESYRLLSYQRSGIDQGKGEIKTSDRLITAIACYSRLVFNDRLAPTCKGVKER
jgi:hypothetical protein